MLRSEYRLDSDHSPWVRYTSSKVKGINLGYEYELQTKKKLEPHKLPQGFWFNIETFHHRARGPEIKSPIATLFHHKLLLKRLPKLPWNKQPQGKANAGGIHVHIDKDDCYWDSRDRIAAMFKENRDKLFKISGRNKEMFNHYAKCDRTPGEYVFDPMVGHTRFIENYELHTEHEDSHYNVLNTGHENTYEFRLFAAHPRLLLPALEMADSLFEYARPHNKEVTWGGWVSYIKRWPRYSNIYQRVRQTCE